MGNTGGSPLSGGYPSTIILIGGHLGQNRTYLVKGIPGGRYKNGPHMSSCTPEMVGLIQGGMQRRVQYGFSILLPAADAMRIFGAILNISRITVVP